MKKAVTILDVGSGTPSIFNIPFMHENTVHLDIERTAYSLDILADAYIIPFEDQSFDVLHVSHVLEQLSNPCEALEEFRRVARKIVIIKVPNASRMFWNESPSHLFSWNQFSLDNLLSMFFPRVEISPRSRLARKTLMNRLKNLIYCALFRQSQLYAICWCENHE